MSGPHSGTTPEAVTTSSSDRPTRVVLGASGRPDALDAALWATSYAKRRGRDIAVARPAPRADAPAGPALRGTPDVAARALVAESRTADVVVLSARTEAERWLALVVAASAHCPVVAVPPGAAWRDDLPVLIGTDGDGVSRATLLSGFALAEALGTGVRVVCCTRGSSAAGPRAASTAHAVLTTIDLYAGRHPDVPVDVRVAGSHPVTGLVRHARLASLLVVGCTPTTGNPTSRGLLDHCSTALVLVGPRAVVHERPASPVHPRTP
ncbi:hypothetical protein [Saccharothrix sp. Mg75]|uniref:hypothetical protein n=1 Tax=Saccharothrix sp. Mg75 TaxID=3445357 RepID=UPI003EEAA192